MDNKTKLLLGSVVLSCLFVKRKPVKIGKCSPQIEDELRENSKKVKT